MIGSIELAREIATFPWLCNVEDTWIYDRFDFQNQNKKPVTYFWVDHTVCPDGWTLLGTGCSRNSYLGPDGVVYKVENNNLFGECDTLDNYLSNNFCEAYAFEVLGDRVKRDSKAGIRMAECHYFDEVDVLAMEYSQCIRALDYHSDARRDFDAFGLGGDLHPGNVWIDNRGPIIIDYAHVVNKIKPNGEVILAYPW